MPLVDPELAPTSMEALSRDHWRAVVAGILGVLVLSLAVVCWRQHLALERLRFAIVSAEQVRRAAAETALAMRDATARELAAAKVKLALLISAPPPAAPRLSPARDPRVTELLLNNSPEHLRYMRNLNRAALHDTYGVLFKQLALSPEKLEAFQRLLIDRTRVSVDARQLARDSGSADWKQLTEAAEKPLHAGIDAEIRTLLGDQNYESYAAYRALDHSRPGMLEDLRLEMDDADTPITEEQQVALARIMHQTGAMGRLPWGTATEPVPRLSAAEQRAVEQAGAILTPTQRERLAAYLTEENDINEVIRRHGFVIRPSP